MRRGTRVKLIGRRASPVGVVLGVDSANRRRIKVRWDGNTLGAWYRVKDLLPLFDRGSTVRFNRQRRLLDRCRRFLEDMNRRSDALCYPVGKEEVPRKRGPVAQTQYDRAKRIIRDIQKEMVK